MYFLSVRKLVATALLAGIWNAAAEPVNRDPDKPPIVRTEADLAQGRQNVKSVIAELKALMDSDTPLPALTSEQLRGAVAPPYARMINGSENRSTLVFRPRFTSAKEMAKALEGVIPMSALIESLPEQNVLIINASENDIAGYKEILTSMDVPSSQILIEAKVVEVIFSDAMQRNLSMSWTGRNGGVAAKTEVPGQSSQPTTGLGGNFTPVHGANTFNIAFQWLLTAQDARVLSSPNILISRNETSRIVTGEDIPIQEANTVSNNLSITTKFKSVGVTLEVEPSMINDDNVTLRVFPQVSNVTRYETITTGTGVGASSYSVPVISVRSVETYLKMQNKQVAMMGGLYSSRKTLQQQRVPFLSDIPYIGEFFTGKNDVNEVTQLVFFLKVHIIPPERHNSGVYYDPDRNAKVSEGLGDVLKNSESFPLHRTSVENLKDELTAAAPGREAKKRDSFRRSNISVSAQGEAAVETSK